MLFRSDGVVTGVALKGIGGGGADEGVISGIADQGDGGVTGGGVEAVAAGAADEAFDVGSEVEVAEIEGATALVYR